MSYDALVKDLIERTYVSKDRDAETVVRIVLDRLVELGWKPQPVAILRSSKVLSAEEMEALKRAWMDTTGGDVLVENPVPPDPRYPSHQGGPWWKLW